METGRGNVRLRGYCCRRSCQDDCPALTIDHPHVHYCHVRLTSDGSFGFRTASATLRTYSFVHCHQQKPTCRLHGSSPPGSKTLVPRESTDLAPKKQAVLSLDHDTSDTLVPSSSR